MEQTPIIRTSGIHYSYAKDAKTLSDINLHVNKGDIYGFIGPNGSGKTTTLSLLLGLLPLQDGQIEIFGKDFRKNRIDILRRTGSLIETPSLYGHLNAMENLNVYREVYGVSRDRVKTSLEIVGLADTGKKVAKNFSLGMKQRLALALAIMPEPEILVLDEPTNGLDPSGIVELRELIKRLNAEFGITILISSHILSELEKLVTHLGVISRGRMVFQGTMDELHRLQQLKSMVIVQTSDNETAFSLLKAYAPQRTAESLTLAFDGGTQIAAVNRLLVDNGIEVYQLQQKKVDLEQLFINLTTR